MNKKKTNYKNQTIILLSSIILGIIILILTSSYAYYVLQINGNESTSTMVIQSQKLDLTLTYVSGELKLCQTYPITDTEAATCTPYVFTISNNNKVSVDYNLNIETNTEIPSNLIHIKAEKCANATCASTTTLVNNTLSNITPTDEILNTGYTSYNLTSETSFAKNQTSTYRITTWLDISTSNDYANKEILTSIGLTSYKTQ